jgi:hypothetical protein
MKDTKDIKTLADLTPDGENFNKHTEFGQKLLEDSLRKFGAGRSILVDKDGNIIAGNSTTETAAAIGMEDVIVVPTDGKKLVVVQRTDLSLDSPEGRELALADNMTALKGIDLDLDKVQETLGDDLAKAWGMDLTPPELPDDEEIRRKEQEFQQRMAAGEDLSEDEEYLEFLDKFKAKKTTDDCYTPAVVYEAVAKWVENEYKVSRKDFVRPFYPGGDYKAEKYPKGCIVVDNPPFSILAEILNFYKENGVRFFLFAPSLTLFSSSSSSNSCCAICAGVIITYENGASVETSFCSNLEDEKIRFKSSPSLYQVVQKACDEYAQELRVELPKYTYPDYVVTSAFVKRLSKYGIDFSVRVDQSCAISSLDSQRDTKKAIYGKGYLVSEKAAAEKAAAEKAAAEKAAATRWTLSDRERAIIAKLSKNDNNGND